MLRRNLNARLVERGSLAAMTERATGKGTMKLVDKRTAAERAYAENQDLVPPGTCLTPVLDDVSPPEPDAPPASTEPTPPPY